MNKYCIYGTDLRSKYLRKIFKEEGNKIVDFEHANIVIAPIPFSKDGVKVNGEIITCIELIENLKDTKKILISGAISNDIKEKLKESNIIYYDLMENDSMAIYNAIPTSEGAIAVAIGNTEFTLHGSNVLILGYGRIGKVLAKMLMGFGANVYCEARKEKDLALISAMGYKATKLEELDEVIGNMNIIFNTIPEMVIDKKRLDLVSKDTLIVDLASSPGGVDFKYAKETEKNVEWSLALPAKVAPYTAAMYIKNEIDNII